MVSRGDVWLVHLDPTVGHELQKTRPCLVVSPDDINHHRPIALIAPLTSKNHAVPYHIPTAFRGVNGLILLEQTRVVDRRRLVKKLGRIEDRVLAQVLQGLRELFTE